ncbi:hypothetical protein HYR69_03215, partial [Candidatus Sumerlaeota bacterium]|nr:hypothetical protein [Candidatus Sumerlaeota bacterium]
MKGILRSLLFGGVATAGLFVSASTQADDFPKAATPTFYKDVLPVLQKNCQDCHRPEGTNLGGTVAPMSLVTYEDVRPWAKSVAKMVKDKSMPPWHASEAFHGVFRNERTLTDAQISTIGDWVSAGAPAGDPKEGPPPIEWPKSSWSIGTPDLVLSFEKPYLVKDEVEDVNTNIIVSLGPDKLPEDKYITAYEFKPGSSVVHHVLGFVQPPKETGESFQMIGGIAPGSQPAKYVDGYGVKLHANSKFVFQMHYHKEKGPGTAKEDITSVAFKFADKPVHRMYVEAIGDPQRLAVPAGAEDYKIMSRRQWDRDFIVMGYVPHMHLRGVYSRYDAVYPDGKRETVLETPKWNFNWQMPYEYPEAKRFPAGTILEVTMGYNNSASNKDNPDPNEDLVFGPATTDEMNLGWLTWGYAEPTDRDPVPHAIGGRNDKLDPLP